MDEPIATSTDTSPARTTSAVAETSASEPTKAPSSFREAVDKMQAAEEGASTTGEPATTAQETPPKVAATVDPKPAKPAGPIPFEAHQRALDNARTKAREDARPEIEAEVKQRYQWADAIEEPDREELTALYRGLKTDLIGTLTNLIDNASQHPTHAAALRSQAARLLSAARRVQGDSAPADDAEPEPDIPLEDGRAVYSAEQMRKRDEWRERRLIASFDQKLQPFQQDREKAAESQRVNAAYQQAGTVLKQWEAKPHFTEHKADILALMTANPALTLEGAYAEVLITKVLPTASQTTRAAVLADIHHKASAGSLNPQQTNTAQPRKPNGRFTADLVEAHFSGAGV